MIVTTIYCMLTSAGHRAKCFNTLHRYCSVRYMLVTPFLQIRKQASSKELSNLHKVT